MCKIGSYNARPESLLILANLFDIILCCVCYRNRDSWLNVPSYWSGDSYISGNMWESGWYVYVEFLFFNIFSWHWNAGLCLYWISELLQIGKAFPSTFVALLLTYLNLGLWTKHQASMTRKFIKLSWIIYHSYR